MRNPGKLDKEQFGYSMPVNAPLYYPLPVYYKNAHVLSIRYKTDADAAKALLPSMLELPDEPEAVAIFASYPWSTVGKYLEVAQVLACTYQSRIVLHAIHFHVTTDVAMAAGREIAGFPKKIGHVEFNISEAYASYLERPRGLKMGAIKNSCWGSGSWRILKRPLFPTKRFSIKLGKRNYI